MSPAHTHARLEAFSDGVFAIALTLLIIDVKLPATTHIEGSPELWRAIQQLTPTFVAFVLSFCIIFVTWVNHHAALELVHVSSAYLIYANGFMLLTVVVIPFPTSLLGEFGFTDHGAPAVVLYNAVLATQAIAWVLFTDAALRGRLTHDEKSLAMLRTSSRNAYFAFGLYALLAVIAFWFPVPIAIVTTATWAFWLVYSIRVKNV